MKRAVVCVATTERYQRGMARLGRSVPDVMTAYFTEPEGCPPHSEVPYAFKAYALKEVADQGADLVLWCDACILPIRSIEPLWERIEREGYWFCNNGWMNSQWCADSWYEDCFPGVALEAARKINSQVPHVVATSFGLNLKHPIGSWILAEYYRLASNTRAFCGPWVNARKGIAGNPPRVAECGPDEVLGHRHDQSCLSILASRTGVILTDAPEIFAYKGGETDKTILIADGAYV